MAETQMTIVYHYTDRNGYNGIGAQPDWLFKSNRQHRYPRNPDGAYFTILTPDAANLGRRLRIGRAKREYVFEFRGTEGLILLINDRTLDTNYTLYSPTDYCVLQNNGRQVYSGETDKWK